MPEYAITPVSSQETLPSAKNNATKMLASAAESSPSPPAPASTALDPTDASKSPAPSTTPPLSDSTSNSTAPPNPGGPPKVSPPPLPPNNISPPTPVASSPPPNEPPPNEPPPSPVSPPSVSNPVPSPPPSPQPPSAPPPEIKVSPPPAAAVISPPLSPPPQNLSPPSQLATPLAPATPSTVPPPNSSIPISSSPPNPSTHNAPPSQSIPVKPAPSTSSGGEAPRTNGNSSSTDWNSSATSSSSSNGVVVAVTVLGTVVAFVAVFFVILAKRRRRKDGFKEQHGSTQISSFKNSDGQHHRRVSDLGYNFQPGAYGVSGSPLSPAAGGTSHGNYGSYGYHSGPSEATGSRPWFTYEELMGITNGFSKENKIGEGGFGPVYRGYLPDGRTVAVKQLKVGSGQGEREFRAEVEIISRIHHCHLVSLVGYCISEDHRLLVYEFVPNKTLEHHLHGKEQPPMDWQKRMKIALGSARGLVYLHEYCHPRIIHRDIKSANILLDNSFEAMVADFGLAKLANDTSTHVSTRVVGTFGYMAPEYAASGKLTDKSDVFSFGVVLLEIITGRKPVDTSRPLGEESLVEWARPYLVHALETRDFKDLVDPKLENTFPAAEMFRIIEVAASCVRHSAQNRPRMLQVLRALENNDDKSDISNGVKVGQSMAYNSAQYSADIRRFQKLAFGTEEFSSGCSSSTEHEQVSLGFSREPPGGAPLSSPQV